MPSIHPNDVIANLPVEELQISLHTFLQPVTNLLPDVRLRAVAELIAQGIVTSQSPVVTQIAREGLWNFQKEADEVIRKPVSEFIQELERILQQR